MDGITSYKEDRFKSNPLEQAFVETFAKEHCGYQDVDRIVCGTTNGMTPKKMLTDEEKRVALSTIQWLGSPVGQGFLRTMGFIKEK